MLGFAIVDRQPAASSTAVWLTCHIEGSRVNHTNAVVISHDDERHDAKVRALTIDRAVVLTHGTIPPARRSCGTRSALMHSTPRRRDFRPPTGHGAKPEPMS
jgi:hypothetical protein